jgi:hypothetical protein
MTLESPTARQHGEQTIFAHADYGESTVTPYQEITPGFVIGFEDGVGTVIEQRYDDAEQRLLLDIKSLGETRWLTFEFELSAEELKESSILFWSAVLSAAPRISCRMDMRLWSDNAFQDVHINQFVVNATPRKIMEFFDASRPDVAAALIKSTRVTLIMVLPLALNVFALHSYVRFPSG